MKITGELLKSERIKLKLTHLDVAAALKLSPRTILSIEEGNTDELPAKTFVRGFVKSYAEMLKLDSQLVLRQFQEEMGTTQPVSRVVSVSNSNSKSKIYNLEENIQKKGPIATVTPNLKTNLNANMLKISGIIALAVMILGGINQIINKYQKEGLKNSEPNKVSVENLNLEENKSKNIETLTVNENTVATNITNNISTNTVSSYEKTVTVMPVPKAIELVIEALKDTVISYSVGSQNNFKSISLKKNTFQIIKSKSGLFIKVDEGNSIAITVNGISKGLASTDEKPIQLSY